MSQKEYWKDCLSEDSVEVQSGRGKNIIPPPPKESFWKGYFEKFKDPIIIVLLVVFCLSVGVSCYEIFAMAGEWTLLLEPMGVLIALLLATGVGFAFEVKANKEFEILNKVKDDRPVKVIRKDAHGHPHMVEVKRGNVVVGDIVKIESGDEIPADGLLLRSQTLRIDESNFTGEMDTSKSEDPLRQSSDATYPSNFLLRGTTVIEGNGIYKVQTVGMDTEEGKGVKKTQEGSNVKTPLNLQLEKLGALISKISFFLAALIVVGRMIYYFSVVSNPDIFHILDYSLKSLMIAVTLIVVSVPEGLPMSVTISLALSMRKMLKENNLVRKLHACETMGAATVICTDKTGTLTQNRMTVVDTKFYGDVAESDITESIAVNSTAELSTDEDGKRRPIGNPTEGALMLWLESKGVDYAEVRESVQVIDQKPFSTETKYMETTYTKGNKTVCVLKGAPEIVLSMCDRIAGNTDRSVIEEHLFACQSKAMRTLGFAIEQPDGTMMYVGEVGIADPIRDDVKEAIDICRNHAGVRVIIVTGDTPGTAREIGRQIGLIDSDDPGQVISGPEFAALTDNEAKAILKKLKIISRARPEDKARLVELLQEMGEVVAVTGDGTNDAPALSKAQVGLSMGDGTSRAKEASDITIIDNSFSSINKAIMWGRSIYLNIRRFIIFQMTINVCACLIVLLGAFIGMESPLTVTQMLWVNLIMDTFAAMALSSLPADRRVLNDKPRNANSHIIDRAMGRQILFMGLLFFGVLIGLWELLRYSDVLAVSDLFTSGFHGHNELSVYEQSLFFTTFVLLQFWNLFNARYYRTSRSLLRDLFFNRAALRASFNSSFIGIALIILLGQVLIITFGGDVFSAAPLSLSDWGWLLLLTMPVLLIGDIVRWIALAGKPEEKI